jgi:hypothetical protein
VNYGNIKLWSIYISFYSIAQFLVHQPLVHGQGHALAIVWRWLGSLTMKQGHETRWISILCYTKIHNIKWTLHNLWKLKIWKLNRQDWKKRTEISQSLLYLVLI